jgi:hypothetical protein
VRVSPSKMQAAVASMGRPSPFFAVNPIVKRARIPSVWKVVSVNVWKSADRGCANIGVIASMHALAAVPLSTGPATASLDEAAWVLGAVASGAVLASRNMTIVKQTRIVIITTCHTCHRGRVRIAGPLWSVTSFSVDDQ